MKSNTMINFMIFLLCNTIAIIYAKHDALVFNRSEDPVPLFPEIISSETAIPKQGDWVTACPAETQPEKNFIKNHTSLQKNGLFVKKIYEKGTKVSDVEKKICQEPHKLSLAYKARNSTFQFGYEIYYKYSEREQFNKYYNPLDYLSPSDKEVTESMKNKIKEGIHQMKQVVRVAGNMLGLGVRKLSLANERMDFMWLYLFKLRFDLNKKILEITWHEIDANNRWAVPENCHDYSLGAELYEDIDIDKLYMDQKGIFDNFKLLEEPCHSDTPCLIKWSMIPLDQFSLGSPVPAVCSNIVTIPIWKGEVENILKKLDKYLYALFRVLDEPIHVVSGITGERLFYNHELETHLPLYLDKNNKKIPVPTTIYKIVEYKLKNCKLKESLCWYSVAIVIMNKPDFFEFYDYRKCLQDETKDWGWEEITKDLEGNQSQMIYICQNNEDLQEELAIPWRSRVESAGGLNLSKFVYSEDGGDTLLKKDIKTSVDETFRKLLKEGEFINIEDYPIEERV